MTKTRRKLIRTATRKGDRQAALEAIADRIAATLDDTPDITPRDLDRLIDQLRGTLAELAALDHDDTGHTDDRAATVRAERTRTRPARSTTRRGSLRSA